MSLYVGNSASTIQDLVGGFSKYANTLEYGSNVVGAIGGPTLELLTAAWNKANPTLTPKAPVIDLDYEDPLEMDGTTYYMSKGIHGYFINKAGDVADSSLSYLSSEYVVVSPSALEDGPSIIGGYCLYAMNGCLISQYYNISVKVRPVVCLKSSIPAKEVEGGYSLIK